MGGPLSNKRHEPKMDDKDSVYISLIHSKAESYGLALNLNDKNMHRADLEARREELQGLLSSSIVIELCNAWKKLKEVQREEEKQEFLESFED